MNADAGVTHHDTGNNKSTFDMMDGHLVPLTPSFQKISQL